MTKKSERSSGGPGNAVGRPVYEHMLLPWCERITLNLTRAIEVHPGALPQLPHRDEEIRDIQFT